MKNIKIISSCIGIALLLIALVYGVRGLIVNIKTNEFVTIDYWDLEKDPGQFKGYMLRLEAVRLVKNQEVFDATQADYKILPVTAGESEEAMKKKNFRFFVKFDPNNTAVLVDTDSMQTISGIVRPFNTTNVKGGLTGEDPYLIDTITKPIAWYINILLIMVPQIFIYLLVNSIYLTTKRKKTSI